MRTPASTRCAIFVMLGLSACSHEQLDFTLPDSGSDDGLHRACDGGVLCGDAEAARERDAYGAGTLDGAQGGSGAQDTGLADDWAWNTSGSDARFDTDPTGYPTNDGQWPPWCEQMESFEEVCGNDLDDDCDGMVDEQADIGLPCASGCHEGIYVCDVLSSTIICQGYQGCESAPPPDPCGNGLLGEDEECDPGAPGERPGVTCTLSCERPQFVRCVDLGGVTPDLCNELQRCDEQIGACLWVISPQQPRCPKVVREGASSVDDIYPMLEYEYAGNRFECRVTCSEGRQCPSTLSECYMGFCAVPL